MCAGAACWGEARGCIAGGGCKELHGLELWRIPSHRQFWGASDLHKSWHQPLRMRAPFPSTSQGHTGPTQPQTRARAAAKPALHAANGHPGIPAMSFGGQLPPVPSPCKPHLLSCGQQRDARHSASERDADCCSLSTLKLHHPRHCVRGWQVFSCAAGNGCGRHSLAPPCGMGSGSRAAAGPAATSNSALGRSWLAASPADGQFTLGLRWCVAC